MLSWEDLFGGKAKMKDFHWIGALLSDSVQNPRIIFDSGCETVLYCLRNWKICIGFDSGEAHNNCVEIFAFLGISYVCIY